MAKCKICGKEQNSWTATGIASKTGLCNACTKIHGEELARKMDLEAKQKDEAEARTLIPSRLKGVVPMEEITTWGVAYWDNAKSAVGTAAGKMLGAAVLGGFGYRLAGSQHRLGVIAVSKSELFVVDLGSLSGESVTVKDIKACSGRPSVKIAPLNALTVSCQDQRNSGLLSARGELSIKATIPDFYGVSGSSSAKAIAEAIQGKTGRRVSSQAPKQETSIQTPPKRTPSQAPQQSVSSPVPKQSGLVLPIVKCPVCKAKVLPKSDGTCPSCQSKIA
jgi:hypothetical protein